MKSIIGKLLRQRYYIVQELGRSSFSTTYLAEDKDFPFLTYCVVKIIQFEHSNANLNPQPEQWEHLQRNFIAETISLKRLGKHPQIPQLLDYFEENWQFYLVQEFIEGENLEQIIARGLLSETETIQFLQDVLQILDFVHQQGVIHQDIQPSNLIRRRQDNKMCLIDFAGVEQIPLQVNSQSEDSTTQIIGKLGYVPPEQQEGKPNFTSDIYALGKTAIYALSSKSPQRVNLQTVELDTLTNNSREEETQHTLTKISPRLTNILNKMVEQNYQERYQSAAEVLTDLEREENVVYLPPPFLVSPPNEDLESAPPLAPPRLNKQKLVLWALLIVPFVAALITFVLGIYKNMYRGFTQYSNINYQIKIKYPKPWTIKQLEDPITGEVVVFYSPKESEYDIFQERIFITVEDLPYDIDNIEEYAEILTKRIIDDPNYEIQAYPKEKIRLADRLAKKIVYSRKINGINIRQLEIFTIDNDRVYIVTYMSERSKYYKFLKQANKTIKSLEIE